MLFLLKTGDMKYINFNDELFKSTEFEGYYVSESGKIISTKIKGGQGKLDINNPRYHSIKIDKDGYCEVCISIIENGVHKRKYRRLHRLIWETFNGKIENELTVDHIDRNKSNNSLINLQLLTRSDNTGKANRLRKGEERKVAKNHHLYDLTIEGKKTHNIRYKQLILDYGISPYHLQQIKKGNYPKTLIKKGILIERVERTSKG